MPRQGDGSADNAIDPGHNIIHGAGKEESTRVARADKTAPMPEPSKGAGLEQAPATAGTSQGKDQGGRSSTN
ncbi:predicted protein [Chaetomium globosum CBS 148.51]|uniref:Uncharacterized protein n=1 Tax=Chaetomium globosum (strain ATCC 6205 / CBS 148.51 / DSM 1962 / NBRC 6347 / NRRL 1970) TaxID=306901 RepID=Q2H5A5_CHAGB|nr:uncharacterized protein CHGG_06160 [Chaetomium globosum CBS 148.51]EAQ89541.1 predicted protein [Chaetomium globosum CBS 148.51]